MSRIDQFDLFIAEKDYGNIERAFTKNRTTLPLMFIATPGDKYGSTWTKLTPSAPILQRLVLLAKQSYSVLEKQLTVAGGEQDFKVSFSETVFGIQVIVSGAVVSTPQVGVRTHYVAIYFLKTARKGKKLGQAPHPSPTPCIHPFIFTAKEVVCGR